jgi:hypothetical protein
MGGIMTARQILATTLAEVLGRPASAFLAALERLPEQPAALDREYSPVEAARFLAAFRAEGPGILAWLVRGAMGR